MDKGKCRFRSRFSGGGGRKTTYPRRFIHSSLRFLGVEVLVHKATGNFSPLSLSNISVPPFKKILLCP